VGGAEQVFHRPLHPYTHGLIHCVPNIRLDQEKLATMGGSPPDLVEPPSGCRFHPRCPHAMDICHRQEPPFAPPRAAPRFNGIQTAPFAPASGTTDDRRVACWLYGGGE
jgi:peptide/nickel transport system ATP-binding protein